MRKGVTGVRRLAAVLTVSLVTLLVTGTGAGAATTPRLVNFSSVGTGQVLGLHIQLPSALDPVLNAAGLSSKIDQIVSFSRSIGEIQKTTKVGTGLGQVMDGTLNPLLETIVARPLPKVFATLGEAVKTDSILDTDIANLIKVGVMKVKAVSSLANGADGLKGVISHSESSILGLEVNLGSALTSLLGNTLQPVVDQLNQVVSTVNGGLNTLLNTVPQLKDVVNTLGVNLQVPSLTDILSRPLVKVGLINTESNTGLNGLTRTANGITSLANVYILGDSVQNAVVSIESLKTEAAVAIDGTKGGAVASAVTHIAHLRVLGLDVDLTKDLLKVGNLSVPLTSVSGLTDSLNTLLTSTLGLKIDLLSSSHDATATHAVASAKTLSISLAPLNGALGAVTLDGPLSMAEIAGSPVADKTFDRPLPTTGVPTTAYFLAGPALIGGALLVRRFALSR
jgi:hypothetical protein